MEAYVYKEIWGFDERICRDLCMRNFQLVTNKKKTNITGSRIALIRWWINNNQYNSLGDHKVSEMEDCISIRDIMILDTTLSGFIIFASNGYISRFFSSMKNGFRKMYLIIISFFLRPIYFFSSSEVTFSPLWKTMMIIKSIINEIKYCL